MACVPYWLSLKPFKFRCSLVLYLWKFIHLYLSKPRDKLRWILKFLALSRGILRRIKWETASNCALVTVIHYTDHLNKMQHYCPYKKFQITYRYVIYYDMVEVIKTYTPSWLKRIKPSCSENLATVKIVKPSNIHS